MAQKVKVQQKLGQAASHVLQDQLRTGVVHIIDGSVTDRIVTEDRVVGKVENIFNLGQKIEVHITDHTDIKGRFRFEKIADVYYLVRK